MNGPGGGAAELGLRKGSELGTSAQKLMGAQKGLQQLFPVLRVSPGGLVETQLAGLTLINLDSLHPGWGWRLYISSKSPGDIGAAGPGITP